jgi:hypothetical protein
MNKSKQFAISLTFVTLVLSGASTALLAAPLAQKAHTTAARLARHAESLTSAQPTQAIAYLQLAQVLDHHNLVYANQLADLYLSRHQPQAAIDSLEAVGEGSRLRIASIYLQMGQCPKALNALSSQSNGQAELLKAKCFLEIGEYGQAETMAARASSEHAAGAGLIMAYAAALQHKGSASVVAAAGEVATADVTAAAYGGLPFAESLYRHGLLATAERVASTTSQPNSDRFRLLAAIKLAYQPTTPVRLNQARDDLTQAVAVKPADSDLHQQLAAVLEQLGDRQGADEQTTLTAKLRSGKP